MTDYPNKQTTFAVTRFNTNEAPSTTELRCVSVMIPDGEEYVRILAGLLGQMTRATNWEGFEADRLDRAEKCLAGYLATDWGDCMDCSDVQNCIETDEGVQGAIINEVNNAIATNETTINSILQALQTQYNTGTPMTNSGDSMTPPGTFETEDVCDLDKLWSGCLYLSQYLDQLITDFFEQIAELTEAAKIVAKASGAIPVLGEYIQSVIEFALALQEKVAVTYAGEQSEEVIQNIACDFFCLAQQNCSLSVDDVIGIMASRLGEITPAEFGSVIEVFITGTFEGVQIVEVAYLLALSAIKFGQQFGDALGVRPISDIMRIGASDPQDAWMVICDVCPTFWEKEWLFTETDGGWTAASDLGEWVDAEGWVSVPVGPGSSQLYILIDVDVPGGSTIDTWELDAYSENADIGADKSIHWVDGLTDDRQDINTGQSGEWSKSGTPLLSVVTQIVLGNTTNGAGGTNAIRRFKLTGTGDEPTWG